MKRYYDKLAIKLKIKLKLNKIVKNNKFLRNAAKILDPAHCAMSFPGGRDRDCVRTFDERQKLISYERKNKHSLDGGVARVFNCDVKSRESIT